MFPSTEETFVSLLSGLQVRMSIWNGTVHYIQCSQVAVTQMGQQMIAEYVTENMPADYIHFPDNPTPSSEKSSKKSRTHYTVCSGQCRVLQCVICTVEAEY